MGTNSICECTIQPYAVNPLALMVALFVLSSTFEGTGPDKRATAYQA